MVSFEDVTEKPTGGATREQLARLQTRYRLAADHAAGKDVLEAACGTGIGLGLLAGRARRVVGGDIDPRNLAYAVKHYGGRSNVELREFDAQALPFEDASFDVVLLFEAIYYLPDVPAFLREARRVLRPDGVVLISQINPEWTEFHPSPHSHRYWSARELRQLLEAAGFECQVLGAFQDEPSASRPIVDQIKRLAVKFHLIPRTLKGREMLKRIFFGSLRPLPAEIDETVGEFVQPRPMEGLVEAQTKVLYAIGRMPLLREH